MKNKLTVGITIASVAVLSSLTLVTYAQVAPTSTGSGRPPCPPPGASSTAIYNCPMIPSGDQGYGQNPSSSEFSMPHPSSTGPMPSTGMMGGNEPSLTISGGQGNVKLTDGQVQSVNGSNLTVSIFGINLNVNTANAQSGGGMTLPSSISSILNPSNSSVGASTSTTINAGDMVTLSGTIASSTGIINATNITDLSDQSQMSTAIQSRISQLLQLIEQLRSQL